MYILGYVSYYHLFRPLVIRVILVFLLANFGSLLGSVIHVHHVVSLCKVVKSESGRVGLGLKGERHGSGGHLLVISFFSVFISFIGSVIRLDWEESGVIMFRVSVHLLVMISPLYSS